MAKSISSPRVPDERGCTSREAKHMTIDVAVMKHNTIETEKDDVYQVLLVGEEGDVQVRITLKAPSSEVFVRYPLGSVHMIGITKTGQKKLVEEPQKKASQ